MCFYGYSRFKGDISIVFMVLGQFFMVFKVPSRFFMVTGGFLWLFKVPGWFFKVPGRFS